MATNHILCEATPEAVFAVLSDPRRYGYFVVGTRTIRRFDPRWPDPASRFHHSLGLVVTLVRDITEVTELVADRHLVMLAKMRPWAVNEVTFELTPREGSTRIEMHETPIAGLGATPGLSLVADRLLWARNVVALRRLRRLVEQQARRRSTATDAS